MITISTLYINTNYAFTGNVTFRLAEDSTGEALPCLTPEQFARWASIAIRRRRRPAAGAALHFLTKAFAGYAVLIWTRRRSPTGFTVPQSTIQEIWPRRYVSPESWEAGIPAAWLNYVVNGSNNEYRGETRTQEQQLVCEPQQRRQLWARGGYVISPRGPKTAMSLPTCRHGCSAIFTPCARAGVCQETYLGAGVRLREPARYRPETDDGMRPQALQRLCA